MTDNERKSFEFYTDEVDWESYARDSIFVGRQYLLKDPLDTLPREEKKVKI